MAIPASGRSGGASATGDAHRRALPLWPPPRDGWIAIAGVALIYAAHWFYGALISDTAMVMNIIATLLIAGCLLSPRLRDDLLRLKGLTVPAICFGLVIVVALWTLTPWTPGGPHRPDVVIAVEPTLFVAPVALAAARFAGARTVLHVQDLEVEAAFAMGHLDAEGPLTKLATAFDRWAARRFDRVITISNRMAERIQAKGVADERVSVVRNWVDLSQVRADVDPASYRSELGLQESEFVVLYAGNLGAKQGVGTLLDAAERLGDETRIVFLIAGDGPMRGEVEAAAARLANVRALPFQPEARFGEFLRVANLHVLPQERDAADLLLPSKLGGMLASGRPIVVTADQGTELSSFLGASCRFTPPGDAAALAQAIADMSRAPPDRISEKQRLARAKSLAKDELIAAFERAALFLQDAQPTVEQSRKAA